VATVTLQINRSQLLAKKTVLQFILKTTVTLTVVCKTICAIRFLRAQDTRDTWVTPNAV
jgi:hypothetical protein